MAHTPTPWEITHKFDSDGYPFTIEHEDLTIATIAPDGYDTTAGNAELNTAFIVKAVNNHKALVEALRKTMESCYWCAQGSDAHCTDARALLAELED